MTVYRPLILAGLGDRLRSLNRCLQMGLRDVPGEPDMRRPGKAASRQVAAFR